MTSPFSKKDIAKLKRLVPLHTLPEESFQQLLADVAVEQESSGSFLFREGDSAYGNYYLLDGTISLLSGKRVVERISATDEQARYPIANQLPRKYSARAATSVRWVQIDGRKLSELAARSEGADYRVSDLGDEAEDDWMAQLLQSRIFQHIPAANIQRVIMQIEQLDVEAGQEIIRQGDEGDYYYMLSRGSAMVIREQEDGSPPVELARLGPGTAFGEEALLADSPRNSTVRMLTDGFVVRLGKQDFLDLIQQSLVSSIDFDASQALVEKGDAFWLDVRSEERYAESHLPNSLNLPFDSLRYQASRLATDKHYVVCSDTGRRAVAGAFLLAERGFDVSVLAGGINQVAPDEVQSAEDAARKKAEVSADTGVDERVREAENRARAMEEKLRLMEQDRLDAEQKRIAHLNSLKDSVTKAKKRMLDIEHEKELALKEREALLAQLSKAQGADQQLQERLEKAEQAVEEERERAEHAATSLNEVAEKLTVVLDEREQERDANLRQVGVLKEQVTVLQLELEDAREQVAVLTEAQAEAQGRIENGEELRAEIDALKKQLSGARQERDSAQSRLAVLEESAQMLKSSNSAFESEVERLTRSLERNLEKAAEAEQARDDGLARLHALGEELEQNRANEAEWAEQTKELKDLLLLETEKSDSLLADKADLEQRVSELQERMSGQHAEAAGAEAEQRRLEEVLQSSQQEIARLQEQVSLLEQESANQQADIAAGAEALDAVVSGKDQLEKELGMLQTQLMTKSTDDELTAQLQETIEQLQQEYGAVSAELEGRERELGAMQAQLTKLEGRESEQLVGLRSELRQLEEIERELQTENEQLQAELAVLRASPVSAVDETQLADARRERDSAEQRVSELTGEVESLRGVMEQYVDQIREAQNVGMELETLRSENAALRPVAAEVEALRGELDRARTEIEERTSEEGRETLAHEALRQECDSLHQAVNERQKEVESAEEARQLIEDELEDAHAEIDRLRRELDNVAVAAEEADYQRQEAEQARRHVEDALQQVRGEAEEEAVAALRDERLSRRRTAPLDMKKVTGEGLGKLIAGTAIGVVGALILIELLALIMGKGELFSLLFG